MAWHRKAAKPLFCAVTVELCSDFISDEGNGFGELSLCGVGMAIANAGYNATGVCVRYYLVTLDNLLDHFP